MRARREDRDGADEVQAREQVDEPHQVAQRARPERHRRAVVADDPQAAPALAGRAAAGRQLERHRVDEQQREDGHTRDREHREAVGVGDDEQDDHRGEDEHLQQRVDEQRDEARADARERQLERDALRGRDPQRLLYADAHAPSLSRPARSRCGRDRTFGVWPQTCGSGAGAGATPSSMHPDAFAATRGPAWEELAGLTAAARGRAWRLPAADVLRLGARYREAAADLAYARRRFGDDPVTRRLETLVLRARPLVYGAPARRGSLAAYLAHGYWRAVAERPKPLIAAWLLLLVPAVLAALWALSDPSAAGGLVPADMRSVSEPQHEGLVLHGAGEHAGVSIGIFVNNIQVTFLAYAGGMTLGLLTGYVLVTNGILLGAVVGLATSAGNGDDVLRLIVGTACSSSRASPSSRRPGCASAGRSSSRARGRAPRRSRPRPRARSASCSGRCRGSCSPASSRASSPAATRRAVVLPLGIALGALYWTLVLTLGRAPSPAHTH